jgi:hypothetical protein
MQAKVIVSSYEYSDGSKEEWSGGTQAWRNNNPGNIRSGGYTDRQGAIVVPTVLRSSQITILAMTL